MMKQSRRGSKASTELSFNHAMVYCRDMAAALRFYGDLLGFHLLEEMEHDGRLVYARLKAARGDGTLALHAIEPGKTLPRGGGIRLYFETTELERLCKQLLVAGLKFSQLPKLMPWGWKHAYLDDPDGNEVSLYWAGAQRFEKSKMRA